MIFKNLFLAKGVLSLNVFLKRVYLIVTDR